MTKGRHRPATEAKGPSSHRIPVIDKMMEVLETLERAHEAGLSIADIVSRTKLPRSTVYRVLNTLSDHGIISRTAEGDFVLGFRLIALARHVRTHLDEPELVALVEPFLARLSDKTGETCKLSLLKNNEAEVVAVVQSPNAMALSSRVGSRFPLHAGAASKLLLAYAPRPLQQTILGQTLERYTDQSITKSKALEAEMKHIRETDLSLDRGEWNSAVHAAAVPIRSHAAEVIGAISVTYFATDGEQALLDRITPPLRAVASDISSVLGFSS